MRTLILLIFMSSFYSAFSQVDTIVWEKKTSLPDSVQGDGSGCFLIDSDFYVVGGEGGTFGTLNMVWKYHIPSDNWIQLGNLPFGGAGSTCAFALNGKGYFLTARDSVSNNDCDTMLWEYTPGNDSWTRKANFPDAPRQNSCCFSYRNKGYVGQTYGCGGLGDHHFWSYDPILDKWSQVATLPVDISAGSAATAIISANAYLVGGYTSSGFNVNDLWHYNIQSNNWDSVDQIPGSARAYATLWGFDSILISGGGSDGYTVFNDFYRFDLTSKTWSPVVFQNSFDSAGAGVSFIYNKHGYYFGGYSSMSPFMSFNSDMWSFDASKYIHDTTTTGIKNISNETAFTLYPNPITREQSFSIYTTEAGDISFCDELGRLLDERKLVRGINQIMLSTRSEVVSYHAALHDGSIKNGKVVFLK